jgi:hypothetical protein
VVRVAARVRGKKQGGGHGGAFIGRDCAYLGVRAKPGVGRSGEVRLAPASGAVRTEEGDDGRGPHVSQQGRGKRSGPALGRKEAWLWLAGLKGTACANQAKENGEQ